MPGAAADEDQVVLALAEREDPERAAQLEPVADRQLLVSRNCENSPSG